MTTGLLFKIIIDAALVKNRAAPNPPTLVREKKVFTKKFDSQESAETYADKCANTDFPKDRGWNRNIYVIPTLIIDQLVPSGKEGNLVKEFMDSRFQEIQDNAVWASASNFSDDKRPRVQLDVILSFMRKPGQILDNQPTLPKERMYFWDKIQTHLSLYLDDQNERAAFANN